MGTPGVAMIVGWRLSKRHRKETLVILEQMDNIVDNYYGQQALDELQRLKTTIKRDFKNGKLEEGGFDYLIDRLEKKMDHVRKY